MAAIIFSISASVLLISLSVAIIIFSLRSSFYVQHNPTVRKLVEQMNNITQEQFNFQHLKQSMARLEAKQGLDPLIHNMMDQ